MLIYHTYNSNPLLGAWSPTHYLQQKDESRLRRNMSFSKPMETDVWSHNLGIDRSFHSHNSRTRNSVSGPHVVSLVIRSRVDGSHQVFYVKDTEFESKFHGSKQLRGVDNLKSSFLKSIAMLSDEGLRSSTAFPASSTMSHDEINCDRRNVFLIRGHKQNDVNAQTTRHIGQGLHADSNNTKFNLSKDVETQHMRSCRGTRDIHVPEFEEPDKSVRNILQSRRAHSTTMPRINNEDQVLGVIEPVAQRNQIGKAEEHFTLGTGKNNAATGSRDNAQVHGKTSSSSVKRHSGVMSNNLSPNPSTKLAMKRSSVCGLGESPYTDNCTNNQGDPGKSSRMHTKPDQHRPSESVKSHKNKSPSIVEVEDEEFAKLRTR